MFLSSVPLVVWAKPTNCMPLVELIYSDLWGPAPIESTTKHLYYVTFVDASTRFTWMYLLKRKSDTLEAFKQFKALVELQFGEPIKALQSVRWGV